MQYVHGSAGLKKSCNTRELRAENMSLSGWENVVFGLRGANGEIAAPQFP